MIKDSEDQSRMLSALYLAQEKHGWINQEAVEWVSEKLGVSPGQVLSTASFYSMMKLEPRGNYLLQVCEGLSCYLAGGAEPLIDYLCDKLEIKPGETTEDGLFTLEIVQCLAACGSAPALRVNDELYENMTLSAVDDLIAELREGGI